MREQAGTVTVSKAERWGVITSMGCFMNLMVVLPICNVECSRLIIALCLQRKSQPMTVERTSDRITRETVVKEAFSILSSNLRRPSVTMSDPLIEWPWFFWGENSQLCKYSDR